MHGPRVAWTPPRQDVLQITQTLHRLTPQTATFRSSASLGLPLFRGYTGFGVMNPHIDRPAPTFEEEPLFAPRPKVEELWRVHRGNFRRAAPPAPEGREDWYAWPDQGRTFERYLASLALQSGTLDQHLVELLVADGALPQDDGSFRDPTAPSRWARLRDRLAW
jgi:hypothetical protein